MIEKLNKHYVMILGILFVSLLFCIPLFINPYHINNDTLFHVSNISVIVEEIKTNFLNGMTMKIVPNIANNFGYGTRLFYPPLIHILTAYLAYGLSFFNVSVIDAMKVMHLLVLFLSGISMYYCAYRFSSNKLLSFISALIYISSSYHIDEIYVRDSEAEALLFVFLPLIITSVKELLEGNKKLFYPLFIIGYVGGILSHFTMMIYFTLILGVSMLFFYKKVFKKEFLIPFIKATILVLLLTLFFFEPLFEHKLFGNYRVYQKWVMSLGVQHTALWGFEYFWFFAKDKIYFYLSIVTITLLVAFFKYYRNSLKDEKVKLVFLFTCFSLWLSTVYFPWIIMPYTMFMIQFGWRLVTLVILGVSFIAPMALRDCKNKIIYVVVILGLIISGFTAIHFASDDIVDINSLNYVYGMGWQREYLPVDMESNLDYYNSRGQDVVITDGKGSVETTLNKVPDLEFKVISDDVVTIEMPRIFYFGYELVRDDKDEIPLFSNGNGFLASHVTSGSYKLKYKGTNTYRICMYISLTTLILLLIYVLVKKIKKCQL